MLSVVTGLSHLTGVAQLRLDISDSEVSRFAIKEAISVVPCQVNSVMTIYSCSFNTTTIREYQSRRIDIDMGFTQYSGSAWNYPSKDTWKSWPAIFDVFKQSMVDAGDTWDDVRRIFVAITDAARAIGVEERVILCMIIKESSGYVGVDGPRDNDGKVTGGLMQAEESPGFPGRNNLSQVRNLRQSQA